MNQVVNEPVDVIVKYVMTKVKIIKFKRGSNRVYSFKKGNLWVERIGNNIITHYVVTCERQGISDELSHDHLLNKWLLVQFEVLE